MKHPNGFCHYNIFIFLENIEYCHVKEFLDAAYDNTIGRAKLRKFDLKIPQSQQKKLT